MKAPDDRNLGAAPPEGAADPRRPSPGILAVIALATPAALGLETLARTLLLPAELAQMRQELRPALTPIAWGWLALTALSVPLGLRVSRSLTARYLAKAAATGGGERRLREARLEAMFVATSVPQIPAILATFTLTAGSEALPALLATGLSAAAVIAIGLWGPGGGRSRGPGEVP